MGGRWTRDLLGGEHPTTGPGDFTVVVDQDQGDRIVSTLCLISQTLSHEDVPVGVGRIELVGTDPAYRRKGLIRIQMDAIHARSAGRGEQVQAITGIPWYYRQFGYEMALDLGGHRRQNWHQLVALKKDQQETYRLRRGMVKDIPELTELYAHYCRASMVYCLRDMEQWRWIVDGAHPDGFGYDVWMVENLAGVATGYLTTRIEDIDHEAAALTIYEVAASPGTSLQSVCEFAGRALKLYVDDMNNHRKKPLQGLRWSFGTAHPAYEALDRHLDQLAGSYAWYVRVRDLPAFLRHIAPVLERRLRGSVVDGYSGTLRLNLYHARLALTFASGMLRDVGSYQPARLADGDASLPDLTFLQLLFGHRNMDQLNHARPDCFSTAPVAPLLNVLFPRRPSCPLGLF